MVVRNTETKSEQIQTFSGGSPKIGMFQNVYLNRTEDQTSLLERKKQRYIRKDINESEGEVIQGVLTLFQKLAITGGMGGRATLDDNQFGAMEEMHESFTGTVSLEHFNCRQKYLSKSSDISKELLIAIVGNN